MHISSAIHISVAAIAALSQLNYLNIVILSAASSILFTMDPYYLYSFPSLISLILFRSVTTQNSPLSKWFISLALFVPFLLTYILILFIQFSWEFDYNHYHLDHHSIILDFLHHLASTPSSAILHSFYIQFQFSKSSPTVGVLWYFFIQIFERFRSFFILIFPASLFVHCIALTVRLFQFPLFAFSASTALSTIFHPAPTLQHYIYAVVLLLLNITVYQPHMNKISLSAFVSIHVAIGMLVMWHTWISLGSGNPNFVFVQGILFSGSLLFVLLELISSSRRMISALPLIPKSD
jgi:hypothetical protein